MSIGIQSLSGMVSASGCVKITTRIPLLAPQYVWGRSDCHRLPITSPYRDSDTSGLSRVSCSYGRRFRALWAIHLRGAVAGRPLAETCGDQELCVNRAAQGNPA